MKEKDISRELRIGLKKNFPGIFWERIENSCARGTADINVCFQGICAKIESKHSKHYSKTLMGLNFTVHQQLYADMYKHAKGRWFLYVRIRDSFYLLDEIPENFLEAHLREKAVYQAHNKKIDYYELGKAIFSLTT